MSRHGKLPSTVILQNIGLFSILPLQTSKLSVGRNFHTITKTFYKRKKYCDQPRKCTNLKMGGTNIFVKEMLQKWQIYDIVSLVLVGIAPNNKNYIINER